MFDHHLFYQHSFHGNITQTHIVKRIGARWWRMKLQKLRVFQLENTTKHWQCILEGRPTEVEEYVWFFSLWDTDNKLFLAGLAKPATLTLPASLPAWDSSHRCTSNSNSIWIWKWIHWLAAVLINLSWNNQAVFNFPWINALNYWQWHAGDVPSTKTLSINTPMICIMLA